MTDLRAPFPWFGGKSRAASIVWDAFGNVRHYVEPFAGSLAVLLEPQLETVNDLDCYIANFWRAVKHEPDAVAEHADWPVNEADLSARHQWLVDRADFREAMAVDPDVYDVKIAGWWVWGLCAWIGSGWCDGSKYRDHRKLPHLGDAGRGVNRQLPHLGNAGQGVAAYMRALSERLRNVRVACGSWERVLGANIGTNNGLTGVFLDPPYVDGNMDYGVGGTGTDLSAQVRAWAVENANRAHLRIALCGYEGEHDMPAGWRCAQWKARKGYAAQGSEANDNQHRERVWLSPNCLGGRQPGLFGAAE